MGLKIYNMKIRVMPILGMILLIQIVWWLMVVVPKSNFFIPETVNKVLLGDIPLRKVYQDKNLFKAVYLGLGNMTPIGLQFDTIATNFNTLKKHNKLSVPNYYTVNDWALGMLYSIPFNDLASKPNNAWVVDVSRLMHQSPLKPLYGQENETCKKNKELIEKWKDLLNTYLK